MFKLFLLAPIVILALILILLPIIKFIRSLDPAKPDPVKEAVIRLEMAKKELEAARLNKEAENLYEQLYQEAVNDYNSKVENSNVR